jgi:hypothetical protein
MIMAERSITLRVSGVIASSAVRSQAFATSWLNFQSGRASGSRLSKNPVASSLAAS